MKQLILIPFLLWSISVFAETVSVTLSDGTLLGFCQTSDGLTFISCEENGKKYLIANNGAEYNALSFDKSDAPPKNPQVTQIIIDGEGPYAQPLFQKSVTGPSFDPSLFGAAREYIYYTSMKEGIEKKIEKIKNLPSETLPDNFLADVQLALKKTQKGISDKLIVLSDKKIKLTLTSNEQLQCKRLPPIDLASTKTENTGTKVACGVLNCGKSKAGDVIYLLMQEGAVTANFPDVIPVNSKGIPDGYRYAEIRSSKESLYKSMPSGPVIGITKFTMLTPKEVESSKDLFDKYNSGYYSFYFKNMTALCRPDDIVKLKKAYQDFRDKLANTEVLQYIILLNDSLGSGFLTPGSLPAGSCIQDGVYYSSYASYAAAKAEEVRRTGKKIVDFATAKKLFEEMKAMDDIAWKYKKDGCYARAHLMARRMEDKGYYVDKAWLKGDLKFQKDSEVQVWNFHVAPILYIDMGNGESKAFVIDPSVNSEPVPVETWANQLSDGDRVEKTAFPFPSNTAGFSRTSLAFSNSDVYTVDASVKMLESEKMNRSLEAMQKYKGYEK